MIGMAALWDSQAVLGLNPSGTGGLHCIGTISVSSPLSGPATMLLASPLPTHTSFVDANLRRGLIDHPASDRIIQQPESPPRYSHRRCARPLRPTELHRIRTLLQAMSRQMPDEIDHNVLLHLARACLCTETPGPHRGEQEADVIYGWTELLSREAEAVRARAKSAPGAPDTMTAGALLHASEAARFDDGDGDVAMNDGDAVAYFSPASIRRERARGMTVVVGHKAPGIESPVALPDRAPKPLCPDSCRADRGDTSAAESSPVHVSDNVRDAVPSDQGSGPGTTSAGSQQREATRPASLPTLQGDLPPSPPETPIHLGPPATLSISPDEIAPQGILVRRNRTNRAEMWSDAMALMSSVLHELDNYSAAFRRLEADFHVLSSRMGEISDEFSALVAEFKARNL